MTQWENTTLGNLAQYVNGRGFKKSEWREDGVPIIRIQNLTGSTEKVNYFRGQLEEKHYVRRGDLLLSWAATLDVYEFDQHEGALNQHIFKVIPKTNVDQKFLYYLLKNKLTELYAQTHGSGMVHITAGKFKAIPATLPSLQEQEKIVTKIEELFSEIDNAIKLSDKCLGDAKKLRQSLLGQAFKSTDDLISVEKIANVGTGSTPLRSNNSYWQNGETPWITSGALNEEYVKDAKEFVTDVAIVDSRLKIYPSNTLLIALYGEGKTRGKCSELTFPATINQAIASVQLLEDNDTDRRYLKWFFMMNYENVRMLSAGGVQPNLNLGIIKKIVLPWPERETKKKIVERLETALSEAEHNNREIMDLKHKMYQCKQSVLAKAFKGELL